MTVLYFHLIVLSPGVVRISEFLYWSECGSRIIPHTKGNSGIIHVLVAHGAVVHTHAGHVARRIGFAHFPEEDMMKNRQNIIIRLHTKRSFPMDLYDV